MASKRRCRSAHSEKEKSYCDNLDIDEEPGSNVRVVCRMRPLNEREKKDGTLPAAHASSEKKEVAVTRNVAGGTGGGARQVKNAFQFDEVLGSFSTQYETFSSTVKPLIKQVLSGYDATVVAYGQTGTGKTFTMEGDTESDHRRGLVPRAAGELLQALSMGEYSSATVSVSNLEIHNEELRDLLAPTHLQQKLDLMESTGGMSCIGLSETPVSSVADVLELVRKAQERKRVAETRVNARSSRSHCIFTMKVVCRRQSSGKSRDIVGKLHLVDLAGSECAKKAAWVSETNGTTEQERNWRAVETERERRAINQSLLTLGRVIAALREEKTTRIPYRDSKLTRVLKDSLGGSCQTVLIVTVTPAANAVEETISTLAYAEQATGIVNRPTIRSLLNTQRSSDLNTDTSISPAGDTMEVAELHMKISYLSQEVDEAQSLLERKRVEAQVLSDRADRAEAEAAAMRQELESVKAQLEDSRSKHTQVASSAQSLGADVTSATDTLAGARDGIIAEIAQLKQQRAMEEQLNTLLTQQNQELSASSQELHSLLSAAKVELADTQSQVAELKSSHEKGRARTLDAIMKLASAELDRLGHDFDRDVDSISNKFHAVEVCADSVAQGIETAKQKNSSACSQMAQAASAWAEQIATRLSSIEEKTCDAVQGMQAASTNAVMQLDAIHSIGEKWGTCADVPLKENAHTNAQVPSLSGKLLAKRSHESPKKLAQSPNRIALRGIN